MLKRALYALSSCVVLAIGVGGCGETPAPIPPVPEAEPAKKAFDTSHVPEAADEAVANVARGMQDGHPEALWHFLPASYQGDVNDVIRLFATRMDSELWGRTVAVLKKAVRVFKEKKEFLQAMTSPPPGAAGNGSPPPDIPAILSVLETLLGSEIGDLERLKKVDAGDFLAVTGGRVMQQLEAISKLVPADPLALGVADLQDLKVQLVSSDGDQATVLIEAPGAEPRETEFVRVEGKWVPKNLADNWIESIGEAKARLALISAENLAQIKPQWLTLLKTVDGALDDAADAKDPQQFAAALMGIAFSAQPLIGMLQNSMPADETDRSADPADPTTPPDAVDLVTVVVRGKLEPGAQDELVEKLRIATGATENVFAEFTGDDQVTSFKIGPVSDIDAFVEKLTFLKISNVSAATRTITARPASE